MTNYIKVYYYSKYDKKHTWNFDLLTTIEYYTLVSLFGPLNTWNRSKNMNTIIKFIEKAVEK